MHGSGSSSRGTHTYDDDATMAENAPGKNEMSELPLMVMANKNMLMIMRVTK